MTLRTVVVVGAGLIGSSLAMALVREGVAVYVVDADARVAETAAALGAGSTAAPTPGEVELVVAAVPPDAVAQVWAEAAIRYPAATLTDVASVKTIVLAGASAAGLDLTRVVGSHPLAGRETSGPTAARVDLFEGRPWVVSPSKSATDEAVARVRTMVELVGATVIEMDADEHDRAVATASHVPQVAASAVAAQLLNDAAAGAVSGQGLRDVTRIAASDADLWTGILTANATHVADVLDRVQGDLTALRDALRLSATGDEGASDSVRALLTRGREGHALIPGKHGGRHEEFANVSVVIDDRAGALARLFAAADAASVNVEDVTIEHATGAQFGLISLAVTSAAASPLREFLTNAGWRVLPALNR